LRQQLRRYWRDHGAQVDAHVEDREARIAARIGLRIKPPDHGRDDRLEQAIADDHGRQAEIEHARIRNRDQEQPGRHDQCTQQDRALEADELVGDVTAEDRAGVHQCEIGTVEFARRLLAAGVAAVELRHDVQHHCPTDSVEREAFPELGHEEHPQRLGMPEDLLELGRLVVTAARRYGQRRSRRFGGVGCGCVHAGHSPWLQQGQPAALTATRHGVKQMRSCCVATSSRLVTSVGAARPDHRAHFEQLREKC
jgi:hypothetical protein